MDLHEVFNQMVRIANSIKPSPTNFRLFSRLLCMMRCGDHNFLLHSEVHWLLWGKVVSSVGDQSQGLKMFSKSILRFVIDQSFIIQHAKSIDQGRARYFPSKLATLVQCYAGLQSRFVRLSV